MHRNGEAATATVEIPEMELDGATDEEGGVRIAATVADTVGPGNGAEGGSRTLTAFWATGF